MPPPGTLVLCYHRFTTDPSQRNGETVSVADFEKQMTELVRRHYRTITLSEMERVMRGQNPVAGKTVVITLDDGWKSQDLALAVLRRHEMNASFAIFPGSGLGNDYYEWANVEALAADPLFEVFSHSMTHPWARDENLVTWIDGTSSKHGPGDVDLELFESRRLLEEHITRPVEYFAWPRGWYNEKLIEKAGTAGYRGLLTIEPGTNAPGDDPRYMKRLMVDGRCTLQQFGDILDHHRYPGCSPDGPLGHRPWP
jgi:peptidoglycan/xylan/chitin deacetylase (PgdA/CDA1 family)